MELFCLGEGNYTEADVQQLSRCFTGWEIRGGAFRFNSYQHDAGEKTIFGETGPYPDDDAVDAVLDQPSTARFIVGKLIRFFLFDEPPAGDALVAPLADELRERNWDLEPVIQRMLGSNLFFSEYSIGRKVRSPVDLVIGLLRALQASANTLLVADDLMQLGQGLFYPPNVKGWDGGRAWINSSTLLGRANVVRRLVHDDGTRFGGEDLAAYFEDLGAVSAPAIVDAIVDLTLAIPISDDARARLIDLAEKGTGDRGARIAETIHATSTLPEFQIC